MPVILNGKQQNKKNHQTTRAVFANQATRVPDSQLKLLEHQKCTQK